MSIPDLGPCGVWQGQAAVPRVQGHAEGRAGRAAPEVAQDPRRAEASEGRLQAAEAAGQEEEEGPQLQEEPPRQGLLERDGGEIGVATF